jgi:hypothetical protein
MKKRPDGVEENCVYEYDGEFKFKRHVIKSRHTMEQCRQHFQTIRLGSGL